MGKASSSKKVAKAAASGRRSRAVKERSLTFPAAIVVVVVLGVGMIVAANNEQANADDTAPQAGLDHWHAAFGIYVCDTWLPDLVDQNDPVGIHTHADGVIHIHPFLSKAAGTNARMDDYFEATGLDASPSRIEMPEVDGGEEYEAGRDCAGTAAEPVRLFVWDNPDDTEPEIVTDDFGDQRFLADGQMFALVLAPADAEVPVPPTTVKLQDLSLLDDYFPEQPNPGTTVAPDDTTDEGEGEGEGTTDTTVAAEGESDTTTTVAADASTTTASP